MKLWFVVLMLGWGKQGGIELMPVADEFKCNQIGEAWVLQMTHIQNEGNFWLEYPTTYPRYKCFYVEIEE